MFWKTTLKVGVILPLLVSYFCLLLSLHLVTIVYVIHFSSRHILELKFASYHKAAEASSRLRYFVSVFP